MEKELTPQESLEILKSMVASGRRRVKDDGKSTCFGVLRLQ